MTRKFQNRLQSAKTFQPYNSTQNEKPLQASTMPVLINKYNQMIEYFNIIRDHLTQPEIKLNELRQFQRKISQDEDIYFITQDIASKIIYFIIEIAYDEEETEYEEKCEYLAQVLKDTTEIIRSGSYIKREELQRLRRKCQTDNNSPFFSNLSHITTTIVTEAIKLLFATTRTGLHPHWVSSDEEEEENNPESENEVSEEDNEANNLYLLD